MAKILITGGTGFVGHWMQQVAPPEIEITAIGRAGYNLWYWHLMQWDYIIHLAPVDPAKVLECAAHNGARVLYASSGIVYHPENDTEYRHNKIKWEKACLDSGADVVIARLFTFYGEKLDDYKAYTQFTKAAQTGKDIEIWGDGNTVRSYMHGEDMAKWLWAILLKGESGQSYDVGSGDPITMLSLARRIKSELNSQSKIVIKNQAEPMPHYLPVDTEKTKSLLSE